MESAWLSGQGRRRDSNRTKVRSLPRVVLFIAIFPFISTMQCCIVIFYTVFTIIFFFIGFCGWLLVDSPAGQCVKTPHDILLISLVIIFFFSFVFHLNEFHNWMINLLNCI